MNILRDIALLIVLFLFGNRPTPPVIETSEGAYPLSVVRADFARGVGQNSYFPQGNQGYFDYPPLSRLPGGDKKSLPSVSDSAPPNPSPAVSPAPKKVNPGVKKLMNQGAPYFLRPLVGDRDPLLPPSVLDNPVSTRESDNQEADALTGQSPADKTEKTPDVQSSEQPPNKDELSDHGDNLQDEDNDGNDRDPGKKKTDTLSDDDAIAQELSMPENFRRPTSPVGNKPVPLPLAPSFHQQTWELLDRMHAEREAIARRRAEIVQERMRMPNAVPPKESSENRIVTETDRDVVHRSITKGTERFPLLDELPLTQRPSLPFASPLMFPPAPYQLPQLRAPTAAELAAKKMPPAGRAPVLLPPVSAGVSTGIIPSDVVSSSDLTKLPTAKEGAGPHPTAQRQPEGFLDKKAPSYTPESPGEPLGIAEMFMRAERSALVNQKWAELSARKAKAVADAKELQKKAREIRAQIQTEKKAAVDARKKEVAERKAAREAEKERIAAQKKVQKQPTETISRSKIKPRTKQQKTSAVQESPVRPVEGGGNSGEVQELPSEEKAEPQSSVFEKLAVETHLAKAKDILGRIKAGTLTRNKAASMLAESSQIKEESSNYDDSSVVESPAEKEVRAQLLQAVEEAVQQYSPEQLEASVMFESGELPAMADRPSKSDLPEENMQLTKIEEELLKQFIEAVAKKKEEARAEPIRVHVQQTGQRPGTFPVQQGVPVTQQKTIPTPARPVPGLGVPSGTATVRGVVGKVGRVVKGLPK